MPGLRSSAATAASGDAKRGPVNFAESPTETNAAGAAANDAAASGEQQQGGTAEEPADEAKPQKLYKSSRLKGYITLILASIINYSAAANSQRAINTSSVASSEGQRIYAEAVAWVSCLVCGLAFLAHLDSVTPLRSLWQTMFKNGSLVELMILGLLVIWWTIAAAVQTSVKGIAGDGKQQYNLYYSTWCCLWTSCWTLERWLVAYGWASFRVFISSWPFRAPGWIAICFSSFVALMCYLDLYTNHSAASQGNPVLIKHYEQIDDGQWTWLIFVGSVTLLPSIVFIIVELFRVTNIEDNKSDDASSHGGRVSMSPGGRRETLPPVQRALSLAATPRPDFRNSRQRIPQRQNPLPDKGDSTGGKGPLENVLEGFCLVLLVLSWIPTVIVSTSPGGAASLVGNAYFITWINTVFVMETFIWFVHDLRKGVHSALQVKEREYRKHQVEVLQKSKDLETKRRFLQQQQARAAANGEDMEEDDMLRMDLDEMPLAMQPPVIALRQQQQQQRQQSIPQQLQHPVFDLSTSEEGDDDQNEENRQENTPRIELDDRPRRRPRRARPLFASPDLEDALSPETNESTVFFEANDAVENNNIEEADLEGRAKRASF